MQECNFSTLFTSQSRLVCCLLTLFLLDMDTCESPPTYTLRTRVKAHLCETRPLVCSSRNCLCPSLLGKPQDGVASNSTSEGCLQVSIWKEPNPCLLRLPLIHVPTLSLCMDFFQTASSWTEHQKKVSVTLGDPDVHEKVKDFVKPVLMCFY